METLNRQPDYNITKEGLTIYNKKQKKNRITMPKGKWVPQTGEAETNTLIP